MENNKHKLDTEDEVNNIKLMKPSSPVIASINRLDRQFFDVPCYNLANYLLGKVLVRKLNDNNILRGRIVETECYPGGEDKASHSYNGRKTPRTEPMYMQPGTLYVYMTYGMYHCFNISSSEPGGVVLLRAIDPIEGFDKMRELRSSKQKNIRSRELRDHELCNGPSKLCISMDIHKNNCNKLDVCNNDIIWIETDSNYKDKFKTIVSSRIGIDSVGDEWAKKPLRFYIFDNKSVSKRDKKAEQSVVTDSLV